MSFCVCVTLVDGNQLALNQQWRCSVFVLRPFLSNLFAQAALPCSHTFFTRRNVIFGCHFLVSKIQTKFLTATPAFTWGSDTVQHMLFLCCESENKAFNVCNFVTFYLYVLNKGRKQMYWLLYKYVHYNIHNLGENTGLNIHSISFSLDTVSNMLSLFDFLMISLFENLKSLKTQM